MPFFSRFKNKGAQPASKRLAGDANGQLTQKPRYQSTWNSETVVLEEVEELIHACTLEMKSRAEALDAPFLLLPFRPDSDPSPARLFIRNFFKSNAEGSSQYRGTSLQQELRLTEPLVLCSIIKWCWSRMPGGVVTWPVYEGFQIGEKEADMARHAFDTFIPISAESPARQSIIMDFFDLLAVIAAHGKVNGLGGRKLSRLAGWWAFELSDDGKGFQGGYRAWTHAADATSHLFFAYLRCLSPEADPMLSLLERIPRSLQALLASTEYPPEAPSLLQRSTSRVLMLVDTVSPTPFALIRRAKNFEYRDNDRVLRDYAEYEDPIDALTEESKRVLYAVSSTNSAAARSRHRKFTKADESWSAFQNMGFADMDEKALPKLPNGPAPVTNTTSQSLRSEPRSRNADHARPMTPSWADFLSSGFEESDINNAPPPLLLPPEQILPPIGQRMPTPRVDDGENLAPGELAAITTVELDDAFWWVWMTSLSAEEPAARKAVFGRCALIETTIMNGKWLIMEEQVKGASPNPTDGVFVAPKRSFFGTLTKRGKLGRKRSTYKDPAQSPPDRLERATSATPSRTSLAPAQQSKIKEAAAALARKQENSETELNARRGRTEDGNSSKTNSMMTLGLQSEAGPAMKWTSAYDKNAIRAQYLGDIYAGTGLTREDILLRKTSSINMNDGASSVGAAALVSHDAPSSADLTTVNTVDAYSHEAERPAVPAKAPAAPIAELSADDNAVPRKTLASKESYSALQQRSVEDPRDSTSQSPATPKPAPAALAAQRAMQNKTATSPEANSFGARKQENSPGIKKLFSRKKDSRQPPPVQNPFTASLAAPEDTTRRLSVRRKVPGQPGSNPVFETVERQPSVDDGAFAEPMITDPHSQFEDSAISPADARTAEHEFSRFDQSPAMKADSAEHLPNPKGQNPYTVVPNHREFDRVEPAETIEHDDADVDDNGDDDEDEVASQPSEAKPTQVVNDHDRWAAIRENAARRAARESEEHSVHSRPSQSGRTDDGETSGEETIESRVARIKARVAELTGNMDSSSARR